LKKKELREIYQIKRQQLSESQVAQMNEQVADKLFQELELAHYQCLHTFLPMLARKEFNSFLVLEKVWRDFPKIKTVVSKTNFGYVHLQHFIITPESTLIENKWGIPEPKGAIECDVKKIDIVIVPLLAFDAKGYRVGYGKGYYDRFLADCREDVLKVGVSFFEAISEIEDIDQYDIPLDYVITPYKTHCF